jgi:hypothetical protein
MNLLGFASVGLSIAAFAGTYECLRTKPLGVRWTGCFFFTVLSIPSILSAVYYSHVLPEAAWFYTLRSWPGTELLGIFLGCAGGAVASVMNRFLLGVPLFVTTLLALIPYAKPVLWPIPEGAFSDRWRGNACMQSTFSTCGPASVSTILKRLGAAPSERTIARAAYSCASGTEAWYLARYVRRQGYAARFEFRDTFTPSVGLPALVGVKVGAGHFIAVLEANRDEVIFADPLNGEERLPMEKFRKRYQFTGFHMVIQKR